MTKTVGTRVHVFEELSADEFRFLMMQIESVAQMLEEGSSHATDMWVDAVGVLNGATAILRSHLARDTYALGLHPNPLA